MQGASACGVALAKGAWILLRARARPRAAAGAELPTFPERAQAKWQVLHATRPRLRGRSCKGA